MNEDSTTPVTTDYNFHAESAEEIGKNMSTLTPRTCSVTSPEVGEEYWTRFTQWMHCMCVVTFDLNLGQALEFVYPPQFTPTEQEISNICYMAFPDSNSGCMGDTKFHMRLRTANNKQKSNNPEDQLRIYNSDCIPVLRADQSHYWGFVYFRQKRDANLPRGYFQKSFIIVTRLPFFNLYYELLAQLAPAYFNQGNAILQEACEQINREWPALQAGISLQLPLFDQSYQILVPRASSRKITRTLLEPRKTPEKSSKQEKRVLELSTRIIVSVNELELFQSLQFFVENLYLLWELILVAEPIVVVGTSPADCSHMVQSLLALIAPLEYCAEARPYFTIHDSEFKEFTRECGKALPPLILGVTNPFFVKLLKDWPHMLRLVDNQINIQQQQILQKNVHNACTSVTSLTYNTNRIIAFNRKAAAHNTNTSISTSSTSSMLSNDGSAPGLYTKYKPFLKKDKTLIKKVLLGIKTKRPVHVQTALLRRNLLELTQSFMIPLERYMASLMPLQKDISPFKSAPNASAFKMDDFLATLELSGPQLTSQLKGDWKGLYQRFFKSPNFRGWYESRHRELQLTLQDLQLQALSEANLEHWAHDKQEVEIVDMILKLKHKLNLYTETSLGDTGSWYGAGNSSVTRDQIRSQIDCMKELLPPDLRNIVNI